ncbi:MAG: hypothetical protein PHW40_01285, partial [Candidatus Izemoplasmatales bacterium]|nr:hypothetical protein [Candidatus Izemoplasmatales bacterium]
MKRMVLRAAFALLAIGFVTTVAACVNDPTTEAPTTQAPTTAATTQAPTTSATHYYLAGNFSGYVANDEAFLMEAVSGKPGWYQITVSLTADVRDNAYDGHYYKVTDGTWTRCWGTEKYALQPAPASPTGGGLGSIWIYENQDLIVLFDSVNLVIYDSSMVRELENPVIYGDFSNWSLSDENAVVLTQDDTESTLYSGT